MKKVRLLTEGGNAANNLISKRLQKFYPDVELKLVKIEDKEIQHILPENFGTIPTESDKTLLGRILYLLYSKDLLDHNYTPGFKLGSTRLAAIKKYGKELNDTFETQDVLEKVKQAKTNYGDIDVDLIFRADKKQIALAIESLDPKRFAVAVGSELNLAIVLDPEMGTVIQIDFVDASEGTALEFSQTASFLDLSKGVKGLFQILLLRAVALNAKLSEEETVDFLRSMVEKNPGESYSQEWNKVTKLGYSPVKSRFVLAANGLVLAVDFAKEGIKTTPKVKFGMKIPIDKPEDFNKLAYFLLREESDGRILFHAVKIAEFIAASNNFSEQEKNSIWNDFVTIATENKSGISEHDFKTGMMTLANIFKKSFGEEENILKEAREGVPRFLGKNPLKDIEVLELVRKIVLLSGNEFSDTITIKPEEGARVDIVEKMDGNSFEFGINKDKKFFIESSNSGEVTAETYKEKFSFSQDFLKSFESLAGNKEFQQGLASIFEKYGPFKFLSELYPTLTHKGKKTVVFVATKYRRDAFGSDGGLVIFRTKLWDSASNSWQSIDEASGLSSKIIREFKEESVSMGFDNLWKVYSNDEDAKIPAAVAFDISDIKNYIASEENYNSSLIILSDRKSSVEKTQLVEAISRARGKIQSVLDGLANSTRSFLGDSSSYIEGVILRIKNSDGSYDLIKGTSNGFAETKHLTWNTRTKLIEIEKNLESKCLLNVLKLKTAAPAALNNRVKETAEGFSGNRVDFLKALSVNLGFDGNFKGTSALYSDLIQESLQSLSSLLREFENEKKELDVDSVIKTKEMFKNLANKMKNLQILKAKLSGSENVLYFGVLNFILRRRINNVISFDVGQDNIADTGDDEKFEKIILWSGRAQPWHFGHHAMIEIAKKNLERLNASKVVIINVGNKIDFENPLTIKQRENIQVSIYSGDSLVEIVEGGSPNGFVYSVASLLIPKRQKIVGWVGGGDREVEYRRMLSKYDHDKFVSTQGFSPFDVDENKKVVLEFLETPRLFSGTKSRECAKLSFEQFFDIVTDGDLKNYRNKPGVKQAYSDAWKTIRKVSFNLDDEKLITKEEPGENNNMPTNEEKLLREFVRKAIRKEIKILKEAAIEDTPTKSTGLNKLVTVLKMILPTLETSYKSLMTSKGQRDSFRKYVIKAYIDTLAPQEMLSMEENPEQLAVDNLPSDEESLSPEELRESVVRNLLGNDQPLNEVDEFESQKDPSKFIDVTGESEKKAKEEEKAAKEKEKKMDKIKTAEEEEKPFPDVEGLDQTGRDEAVDAYKKTSDALVRQYRRLHDQEDQKTFKDYLVTNLLLYMDKWEDDISPDAGDITTPEYEKQSTDKERFDAAPLAEQRFADQIFEQLKKLNIL